MRDGERGRETNLFRFFFEFALPLDEKNFLGGDFFAEVLPEKLRRSNGVVRHRLVQVDVEGRRQRARTFVFEGVEQNLIFAEIFLQIFAQDFLFVRRARVQFLFEQKR